MRRIIVVCFAALFFFVIGCKKPVPTVTPTPAIVPTQLSATPTKIPENIAVATVKSVATIASTPNTKPASASIFAPEKTPAHSKGEIILSLESIIPEEFKGKTYLDGVTTYEDGIYSVLPQLDSSLFVDKAICKEYFVEFAHEVLAQPYASELESVGAMYVNKMKMIAWYTVSDSKPGMSLEKIRTCTRDVFANVE